MELIDGKATARAIKEEIKAEVDSLVAAGSRRPHLAAVLVGHDGGSETYVAYKINLGPVRVIDVVTGAEITQGSRSDVAAFFWSPDAQKLAYLTVQARDPGQQSSASAGGLAAPALQSASPTLTWRILDVSNNTDQALLRFRPTNEMQYLVAFFLG